MRIALTLTLLALVLGGNPNGLQADEKIAQYRYRPFEDDRWHWISPYNPEVTELPDIVKNQRGGEDDGFGEFWHADFSGNKRYVCSEGIEGNPLSGDFTVQAFFCLEEITNERRTICSTVTGLTGFRLYIEDGRLKGGCHYQDPQGPEELVEALDPLEAGIWYHVALVARRKQADNVNELSLWINSEKVATNDTIPVSRPIDNSTLHPVFGADRARGLSFNNHLNAKVHAIEISDYALSDFYLESKVIRDGSRYFGIPSYHDYLGEGDAPLEKRIMDTYDEENLADFRGRLQDRFFLPFMNDNYIPQGITNDPENGRMFISYYWKDKDYNEDHPSIVAEILMPSGALGNVFVLDEGEAEEANRSHVGGIAYWDGCLFVPDGADLLVYDLSVDSSGTPVVSSAFDPLRMTGFNPITISPLPPRPEEDLTRFEDRVPWNSIAFIDIHEEPLTGQTIIALGDYVNKGNLDDANLGSFDNITGEFLERSDAQELAQASIDRG